MQIRPIDEREREECPSWGEWTRQYLRGHCVQVSIEIGTGTLCYSPLAWRLGQEEKGDGEQAGDEAAGANGV